MDSSSSGAPLTMTDPVVSRSTSPAELAVMENMKHTDTVSKPPLTAIATNKQTSSSQGTSPTTMDRRVATRKDSLATPLGSETGRRRPSDVHGNPKAYRRHRKPEDIPKDIVDKWKFVYRKVRKPQRLRAILAVFTAVEGKPCAICQSMNLTEEKFMINEFAKHSRPSHKVIAGRDDGLPQATDYVKQDEMEFGPIGLSLGKLQNIKQRSEKCGFCRLVVQSVKDQGYILPDSEQEDSSNNAIADDAKVANMNASCHASWQVDGRVLVRDPSTGAVTRERATTRRIRLHWDIPKEEHDHIRDYYVVLIASQTRVHQGLFLGQTLTTTRVDAAKIRMWLESCENHHGPRCHSQQLNDYSHWKPFFGVIDVNDMMLTSLPPGKKYVTLSYVWGQHEFLTTKLDNIHNFRVKDGLRSKIGDLPRTIKDAISLVQQIGQQYLWIDCLCIVQDSDRSWALNSRVMDLVYGNSYLNICAADGKDANAGLRGIHMDSNNPPPLQIIERYNENVRLLCTTPAETYIEQSYWNKRGWTFQERLLSPRNLIFVAGRIYFQCKTTARSGEIITEHPDAGWSLEFSDSPSLFLEQLPSRPLTAYKRALELYMRRDLKYQKDILAAFNGIGNIICDASGGRLVFGLPSSHFDWALLWEAHDSPERRADDPKFPTEKFPSWSWCGWKGQVMEYKPHLVYGVEDNLHEWLMQHTWITWYIRDGNGDLRLVWDGTDARTKQPDTKPRWRGYARPETRDAACVYDEYGRLVHPDEHALPRDQPAHFEQTLDECPFGVNIVQADATPLARSGAPSQHSSLKDMPFLQFFTWSACFRLRETLPRDFRRRFQRYSILDYKDDWCGTIVLDRPPAPRDLDETHEFIAISDAKEFHGEEYSGWAYYIPKEREHSMWDLYYVLLIEVRDNIAYRVGLGKIFKEAFNNSCKREGKRWKEYILG